MSVKDYKESVFALQKGAVTMSVTGGCKQGVVKTAWGIMLFSRFNYSGTKMTVIDTVANGRYLRRSWEAYYGIRTVARLANEWADELLNMEGEGIHIYIDELGGDSEG